MERIGCGIFRRRQLVPGGGLDLERVALFLPSWKPANDPL